MLFRSHIYEELLGLRFKISPFSFFQTNTLGAEKLYSMAREFVGDYKDKVLYDLYSGTGTIGQVLSQKARKVYGIEIVEEAVEAIENLLDIDINYYVKVNFSTIEGVIDAIKGVDVYSDYSFNECAYGIYHFNKGMNHLNGKQALAFARERKSFSDGDIQRVKNQQKVLTAIIDKVTSSTTLVTNFSQILDSVGNSFSTNMETKSINRFIKMQLNDMRGWSIESQNLVGTDLYTYTYTYPNLQLYVMKQDENSIAMSKNKINKYLKG